MRLNPCETDAQQHISCCHKNLKVCRLPKGCPTHSPVQAIRTSFPRLLHVTSLPSAQSMMLTIRPSLTIQSFLKLVESSVLNSSYNLWPSQEPHCYLDLGESKLRWQVLRVTPAAGKCRADADSKQDMCISCSLGAALLHTAKCLSVLHQRTGDKRGRKNILGSL